VIALPSLRRDHALAAAVLLFAGVAAWPWLVSPAVHDRPPAAGTAAPAAALAPLPPLAEFGAIVERPLFLPSRRPEAAIGVAGPAAPGAESRYRLLGLVSAGPARKALVADGARRFEVKEGDRLDDWTVRRVEQDRLVLSSPAGEAVLKLAPAAAVKPP